MARVPGVRGLPAMESAVLGDPGGGLYLGTRHPVPTAPPAHSACSVPNRSGHRPAQGGADLDPVEAVGRRCVRMPRDADVDSDLIRRPYLHGSTAAELAAVLGITVANVVQRTTRAKRGLREALQGRPDLVAERRQIHPHPY